MLVGIIFLAILLGIIEHIDCELTSRKYHEEQKKLGFERKMEYINKK